MNVVLWIVAGLLAAVFLAAGATKLTQPKEKLATSMQWTEDFQPGQLKAIGTVEVLGAIGLILPALVDIAPVLVPVAAVGLGLVMLGAIATHGRRKEPQAIVVNVVLLAIAVFVAWGRFGPNSF